ncbi:Ferric reductase like transmembrane component [Chamaesiphon minutus]|uniref:Ferric reductase like transmembrane component n=1 Tax=Chamaesiphon minutus (strain ATCC 27169 / PCC 6605) TaxID=1173020 RepID=K9UQ27_CHAP6|nr:Ferric reductase like transmembrane component [Chamaesiphon minutus]AFY96556.1 Ferric reductase like transmembrane component [Chamaesiphon minutus PCC 6605]
MKGWPIVMTVTIALGVAVVAILSSMGLTETSTLILVRLTARSSCLLFLLAFIAAPLRRLWQSPLSLWMVQNRRFLGLSMAVSHTYHAIAFSTLQLAIRQQAFSANPLAILGYAFLLAMTITSFSATAKVIGRRAWRVLHTAGMYYFWLIFAVEFGRRARLEWGYLFLTLLVSIAMLVRIFGTRRTQVQPI